VSQTRTVEGATRAQIARLLRLGVQTVDELARAVALTPNAVRQHLATLERDGIVVRRGNRRGTAVGKPATVYEIAPDAEASFSRAYAPVLTALVAALPDHIAKPALGDLLRDVGVRLAAATPAARGDLRTRAAAGAAVLESLGGLTEIVDEGDTVVIKGCSCPLAQAVAVCPELCEAVELMLAAVTGAVVREHCDRRDGPRCRFALTTND
jgi:predicted ArsR family transcriptional regulator